MGREDAVVERAERPGGEAQPEPERAFTRAA